MHKYKKCKRYDIPGHAHELTFSCYRGLPLLKSTVFRHFVYEAIRKAMEKHYFDLWAYVLMPNHVHLLIYPSVNPYSISAILKSIKQSSGRKAVNWFRTNRPDYLRNLSTGQKHDHFRFWQDGGGYDRNVTTKKVALNSIGYIHLNPVRRKLVEHPKEWYDSSYRQ